MNELCHRTAFVVIVVVINNDCDVVRKYTMFNVVVCPTKIVVTCGYNAYLDARTIDVIASTCNISEQSNIGLVNIAGTINAPWHFGCR